MIPLLTPLPALPAGAGCCRDTRLPMGCFGPEDEVQGDEKLN